MKINPLSIVTKSAGALALASVALESNTIAMRKADAMSKEISSQEMLANAIGDGKLNYESPKHNSVKTFMSDYFPDDWYALIGSVQGYFKGALTGIMNNILTVGFSVLALVAKHKPVKILSLIGLASSIVTNFLANSTNLFEITNYLKPNQKM